MDGSNRQSPRHPGTNGATRRTPRESGQVLIIFAVALTALLLCAMAVIDVGLFINERQNAQQAADAASLAAAGVILDGADTDDAVQTGMDYANSNGYPDADDVDINIPPTEGPHAGDVAYVEAIIRTRSNVYFGGVVGVDLWDTKVRAVAVAVPPTVPIVPPAIFAIDDSCSASDPLLFNGSDTFVIDGVVHSNSRVQVSGSDNNFNGGMEYVCPPFQNSGSDNTYTPAPGLSNVQPSPLNYTFNSFPCNFTWNQDTDLTSRPEVWVNDDPNTKILRTGVYCSTRKLTLSGQDITGNVTLVAMQELTLSGSNFNLTGYFENVLGFSASDSGSAIDISGSGGTWTGYFYAPNGRAKVAGSGNASFHASIVARWVTISGQNFSIDSSALAEPDDDSGYVRLVE